MIYLLIVITFLSLILFFVLYHSCRQDKLLKKKDKQLDELRSQYYTLCKNVEKRDGYCAALWARRQGGHDTQMYCIESTDVKEPKNRDAGRA